MEHVVALTLMDATTAQSVLPARVSHTLALWNGVRLVIPRAYARSVAGHSVRVACASDLDDRALYQNRTFARRVVKALGLDANENAFQLETTAQLIRRRLLLEDREEFAELFASSYLFLSNGVGVRIVNPQPHILQEGHNGGTLRVLTVYRTVRGFVPYRFVLHPASAAKTPEHLWRLAQQLFPSERSYFEDHVHDVELPTSVENVRKFRLVCDAPLRQSRTRIPPLRA